MSGKAREALVKVAREQPGAFDKGAAIGEKLAKGEITIRAAHAELAPEIGLIPTDVLERAVKGYESVIEVYRYELRHRKS